MLLANKRHLLYFMFTPDLRCKDLNLQLLSSVTSSCMKSHRFVDLLNIEISSQITCWFGGDLEDAVVLNLISFSNCERNLP